MHNSSVHSSNWNDMTRSSSICKALPAESTYETHEKHHNNTSAAGWKQPNCTSEGKHFPIHLSSTAEHEGGRKDGKNKMEQHENYSIKCVNSLILLVAVDVNVFKGSTYLWPKETLSSSSAWSPSPLEKKTVNH